MSANPLQEMIEPPESPAAAERKRIARELHDTLGYTLTVSVVQLENAGKLVDDQPVQAQALIEAVRGQLTSGLAFLDLTLRSLRGDGIRADDLLSSLRQLTSEFAAATGIVVRRQLCERLPALSDAQATVLFRAAQEGLINAYKHGRARHIFVGLTCGDEAVILTVGDDGAGLAAADRGGLGLRGLRERADQVGGTLTLTRAPEGGAAVILRVPLKGGVDA